MTLRVVGYTTMNLYCNHWWTSQNIGDAKLGGQHIPTRLLMEIEIHKLNQTFIVEKPLYNIRTYLVNQPSFIF
jgi:hypothetical protein